MAPLSHVRTSRKGANLIRPTSRPSEAHRWSVADARSIRVWRNGWPRLRWFAAHLERNASCALASRAALEMGLAVAVGAPLLARGRGWSNDSSLKRENKKKEREREREREPVHVFQMWRTDSYSWWAATVNGFGVVH